MTSSNQCTWQEWTLSADDDRWKLHSRLTRPYLGDNGRYIFPCIGGDTQALHPLLAWWAILFALSMLARYQPETWTAYLDVDKSAHAVPLKHFLIEHLLPARSSCSMPSDPSADPPLSV
jgi:hypothetical protein